MQDTVVSALKLILDPNNYPLSVMCNLGRHRSGRVPRELIRASLFFNRLHSTSGCMSSEGTVIGCMRKLQRWNLTSIFEEYRRHAGSKVRTLRLGRGQPHRARVASSEHWSLTPDDPSSSLVYRSVF